MSDGPHRSLPMPKRWKDVAERADMEACSEEAVAEALEVALEKDFAEDVPRSLLRDLLRALAQPKQMDLFAPQRMAEQVEALRTHAAGRPMANLLLDCAIVNARKDIYGPLALGAAIEATLAERAHRGNRQVEEHYLRRSKEPRALNVRDRIAKAISVCGLKTLVKRLLSERGSFPSLRLRKQTGLDDGVST